MLLTINYIINPLNSVIILRYNKSNIKTIYTTLENVFVEKKKKKNKTFCPRFSKFLQPPE